MTTAFYRNGTVAVTQNSKVVTGTGTNWTTGPTKPLAGDVFIFNNKMYEIDSVVSDTEIRLYRNFEDSTASSKSYAIMRNASLNISARIAAQVAQVVNQKQIMIDEFHDFLTNNTDSTVPLTDTLGNTINVTPIPMLDEIYNQATKGLNDKADEVINSQRARSEADMNQMRKQNDETFDASGMVYMGKFYSDGNIHNEVNEGFWTSKDTTNIIRLGRSGATAKGTSKTDFPVTNIAGFVSNITGLNWPIPASANIGILKLPEAPKGYDVADSTGDCRGSGKAVLNLRTEVDPKFGDIADSDEEAISRAWEGHVKNGDFRDGDTDWRNFSNYAEYTINNGILTIINSSQLIGGIQCERYDVVEGKEYVIGFYLHSGTVRLRRTISPTSHNPSNKDLGSVNTEGYHEVRYTAPAGYTVNSIWFETVALEDLYSISNISIKPVTEEVIINPVDLTGLEGFLREVSTTNPFVYPGGIIQSKATTMNGIATSRSNRPDSYYAVYTGDTSSAGLGVNFFAANTFDQGKMLADESNNLFKLADGRLVQFCIRNRTIRGAGNGDWYNISADGTNYLRFGSYGNTVSSSFVVPQGDRNSTPPFSQVNSYANTFSGNGQILADGGIPPKGVFVENYTKGTGSCAEYTYFLPLATIPRLNQGAYCKGLNEFGTAKWNDWDGTNNNAKHWYEHKNFKSVRDCFKLTGGGNVGVVGGLIANGGNWAGHPSGKYHDVIYASGLNGVIDHRLPAKHMEDDWLEIKQKLESAKFRGAQKLVWTNVAAYQASDNAVPQAVFNVPVGHKAKVGDQVWIQDFDDVYQATKIISTPSDQQINVSPKVSRKDGNKIVIHTKINTTVSGEYSVDTVFGDPDNLSQIDVLKNGFLGYWCAVIPDGNGGDYSAACKNTTSNPVEYLETTDIGNSWVNRADYIDVFGTVKWDNNKNAVVSNTTLPEVGSVGILSSTAYAYQTEEAVNSPIVGGEKGVSRDVFNSSRGVITEGVLLGESLLNLILKDTNGANTALRTALFEYRQVGSSKAIDVSTVMRHLPLNLVEPQNDSPAIKVQYSLVEENGQLFIQMQANELGWESTKASPDGGEVVNGSTFSAWKKGGLYKISGGVFEGEVFHCLTDFNATIDGYLFKGDKGLYSGASGALIFANYKRSSGWGDDDIIKITANGSDTFVDRNGITRKSVCHRSKFPIGWARTAAKVGSENSPA